MLNGTGAMDDFGSRLRSLREARKLSQKALARRLNFSQASISSLESGNRNLPRADRLERLAAFFGVEPSFLIGSAPSAPDAIPPLVQDALDALLSLPPAQQQLCLKLIKAVQSEGGSPPAR